MTLVQLGLVRLQSVLLAGLTSALLLLLLLTLLLLTHLKTKGEREVKMKLKTKGVKGWRRG